MRMTAGNLPMVLLRLFLQYNCSTAACLEGATLVKLTYFALARTAYKP